MEIYGTVKKLEFKDGWCRLKGIKYMVCRELCFDKILAEYQGCCRHCIGLFDTQQEAEIACQAHFEQLIAGSINSAVAQKGII
jgi:hypothetical protein